MFILTPFSFFPLLSKQRKVFRSITTYTSLSGTNVVHSSEVYMATVLVLFTVFNKKHAVRLASNRMTFILSQTPGSKPKLFCISEHIKS